MYRRSLRESMKEISINLNMRKSSVNIIVSYKKDWQEKIGPKIKINKVDALEIKRNIANETTGRNVTYNEML